MVVLLRHRKRDLRTPDSGLPDLSEPFYRTAALAGAEAPEARRPFAQRATRVARVVLHNGLGRLALSHEEAERGPLSLLPTRPGLLDVNCRTIEQMRLANALCRFVEFAELELNYVSASVPEQEANTFAAAAFPYRE